MKKFLAVFALIMIGNLLSPAPHGVVEVVGGLFIAIGFGIVGYWDGVRSERRTWTDGLSRKKRK